jgi:hypothetical protein
VRTLPLVLVVLLVACKREPDPNPAPASGTTTGAPVAAGTLDAGPSGSAAAAAPVAPPPRVPIAASKLELVESSIGALELSDKGELTIDGKLAGTLGADGTFTRDGKVIAELGEGGELRLGGAPADPPVRIDPDGDVFIDGELVMTIVDDGKINTVGKDGAITENVLALFEGPPHARRAVAMVLVLVTTTSQKAPPPPPPTTATTPTPVPEP